MCQWGTTETLLIAGGKGIDVDACIAPLVQALNDGGVPTVASCCGHGHRPGNIALADGRELIICPDYATGRRIDSMIGVDIHGENNPRSDEGGMEE